jgi:hypothetical protein
MVAKTNQSVICRRVVVQVNSDSHNMFCSIFKVKYGWNVVASSWHDYLIQLLAVMATGFSQLSRSQKY